jgi:hypothetical protein
MKGILLDENNDLLIDNGSLAIGDAGMQNAYMVLRMAQGEIKEDPIAGANLQRHIRGRSNVATIRKEINIALKRIGMRLEDVAQESKTFINNKKI